MAMFKAILGITRGYQYTGKSSNQPTTFENLTRAVLDKASVGNDIWRKSHVAHFAQQLVLDKHGPCDEKVHPPKKKRTLHICCLISTKSHVQGRRTVWQRYKVPLYRPLLNSTVKVTLWLLPKIESPSTLFSVLSPSACGKKTHIGLSKNEAHPNPMV